jgi:flagellar biosynthesis protein FlhF
MKIKKFIAPDIRRAIKMVREEQGPDAVIISNRRVDGGVEIISAIDYDESLLNRFDNDTESTPASKSTPASNGSDNEVYIKEPELTKGDYSHIAIDRGDQGMSDNSRKLANPMDETLLSEMREELKYLRNIVENRFFDLEWADYSNNNPINAEIIKRLLGCGVSSTLARDIVRKLPYSDRLESAWSSALAIMGSRLRLVDEDIADNGGIIALVGPTGVGKTTTVAKLAARYALRRGVRHAALLTTDNYRVGAHEQLRTYGRLLDIPVRTALNKDELQSQLDDLLGKDLILIDTAGMSQRDMRISEQLSVLKESKANIKVYLVVSATSQLAGLGEIINVFRGVDLDGCILTKLDEAASIGPAVSAVIEKDLPLAYVSDGQRVPEDLHLARIDKLINQGNFNMNKGKANSIEELMRISMGRTVTNAH